MLITDTREARPMQTVVAIQCLRALAAWMVVGHHCMQFLYGFKATSPVGEFFSHYGMFGVDVFFVISGFIMILTLTAQPRTAQQFFLGRLARIVPVYWFYTMLAIVVAQFCTRFSVYEWTLVSLLKSLSFIPHRNPTGLGWYPLLLVGWTLNIEVFFYGVLAFCLLLTRRYCFAITGLLFLLFPLYWPESWCYSAVLSNSRLSEFSIGLLLGYGYSQRQRCGVLRLGLLGGMVLLGLYNPAQQHGEYLLQYYAALLVFTGLCVETRCKPTMLGIRYLLHLGNISYSTYLVHVLVLVIFRDLALAWPNLLPDRLLIPLILVCIGLMSHWSYSVIEQNRHFKQFGQTDYAK